MQSYCGDDSIGEMYILADDLICDRGHGQDYTLTNMYELEADAGYGITVVVNGFKTYFRILFGEDKSETDK